MNISTHEWRVLTEAYSFSLIVDWLGLLTPCQNTLHPPSEGQVAEPPTARRDTITHQSNARGVRGCTERLRRGRASPTPTGCTQSHPERPRGQGCRRGGQRHPQPHSIRSRPPQGRRGGTRCRKWCGATLSPSRTHSPVRRATGHDRRCRGTATHPPCQESHSRPG